MMTTSSAFGQSGIRDKFISEEQYNPPVQQVGTTPSPVVIEEAISAETKGNILKELLTNAVADFAAKKITKEQFLTITNALK